MAEGQVIIHQVYLKPVSVNRAWQGRRFKTKEYKAFEEELLWMLKNSAKVSGWYTISFKFYVKNYKSVDLSNLIKTTEDIIVKSGIVDDDRFCKRMEVEKFKSETDWFKFIIKTLE
jgi:Holliday junction resolvase RusA-like endonuclease